MSLAGHSPATAGDCVDVGRRSFDHLQLARVVGVSWPSEGNRWNPLRKTPFHRISDSQGQAKTLGAVDGKLVLKGRWIMVNHLFVNHSTIA